MGDERGHEVRMSIYCEYFSEVLLAVPIVEFMKQDRKPLYAKSLIRTGDSREAAVRAKPEMATMGGYVLNGARGIVERLEQQNLGG